MKHAILTFAILGLLSISWADDKFDGNVKACLAETKTTEKDVTDFWNPQVNFDLVSDNMKCFAKCTMEKMGHLKAGVYDATKAAKDFTEAADTKKYLNFNPKAFETCKNEKGANDCDLAFKIIKCLRQFKA